ncbi:transposase [Streptomyces sp. NPDC057910]|uniref:transposase n=1 Tax=Streptomyces sp. NPDC057910 TaxID=3346278 RepID=UPI0036E80B57
MHASRPRGDRGPPGQTDCGPCPVRAQCTTSPRYGRRLTLRSRKLHELNQANRTTQQDPDRHAKYALRSGVEGTIRQAVASTGSHHVTADSPRPLLGAGFGAACGAGVVGLAFGAGRGRRPARRLRLRGSLWACGQGCFPPGRGLMADGPGLGGLGPCALYRPEGARRKAVPATAWVEPVTSVTGMRLQLRFLASRGVMPGGWGRGLGMLVATA